MEKLNESLDKEEFIDSALRLYNVIIYPLSLIYSHIDIKCLIEEHNIKF